MSLPEEAGIEAVKLARESLEAHVTGRSLRHAPRTAGPMTELRGAFVTLNTLQKDGKALRGCIGFPEPILPLWEAVERASIEASRDPRFPYPVSSEELGAIVVEVSILTKPKRVVVTRRKDLPSRIRIGIDGVIVSNAYTSGLFLPQVAPEQGWDQTEFLSEACAKAGLPYDAWLRDDTQIEVFQAEVFAEEAPRGKSSRAEPD